MATAPTTTLTRNIYDAFQRAELDGWDGLISPGVVVNSPAGYGLGGLAALKSFARQFTDLGYRIDLVDEHEALDDAGKGRGFITVVLHWKHTKDFGGLVPTGREGTSVETLLLTVEGGQVTRIDVADHTLDLAIYEWDRNWPVSHDVRPEPLVEGIDLRADRAVERLGPASTPARLTREFYEAFQRLELDRWDAVVSDDVLVNSPAGFGARGLATLKEFVVGFTALRYRSDLVDEHLALDDDGNGRGFLTHTAYWKHTEEFAGLAPTGREGTLVETMLLTVEDHMVTRVDIALNTLDLALYLWNRGFPVPHNIRPEPLVVGVDRRADR